MPIRYAWQIIHHYIYKFFHVLLLKFCFSWFRNVFPLLSKGTIMVSRIFCFAWNWTSSKILRHERENHPTRISQLGGFNIVRGSQEMGIEYKNFNNWNFFLFYFLCMNISLTKNHLRFMLQTRSLFYVNGAI